MNEVNDKFFENYTKYSSKHKEKSLASSSSSSQDDRSKRKRYSPSLSNKKCKIINYPPSSWKNKKDTYSSSNIESKKCHKKEYSSSPREPKKYGSSSTRRIDHTYGGKKTQSGSFNSTNSYDEKFKKKINSESATNYDEDSTCSQARPTEDDSDDSENEIIFDWENYRKEINQMFFNDNKILKRGSNEYYDFWKFLAKYSALQKQKIVKTIVQTKTTSISKLNISSSKKDNLKSYLEIPDVDSLRRRVTYDFHNSKKRLSRKKIEEFKYILQLYFNFLEKTKQEKLAKLRENQKNLPIAKFQTEIVETIRSNSVVIIAGDTGCGKSTQVPQYLLSEGFTNIACTQPRRIACIALCNRVAYETQNEYGSEVGYQIRFEKTRTEKTKIIFLTEGLLLRQITTDPMLSQYDVLILDEIHERHLHTDFLLGVMKCLIMQRPNIKIVLMSATINISLFKSYFLNKVPVIQVPGRLYPIKVQYFPIPIIEQTSKADKINPAPYIRILQLIDSQYPLDERGDVLVFLSGISEITSISEAAQAYAEQSRKWIIIPLHSTLSVAEQEKVFDIPPENVRKCILSTNIAETSVTIDGIRFVIDSGKVKEMNYDIQSKMQKLKEFWVSQASAEQRKGRAGRTGPGVCFRLHSEEEYASFEQYNLPEIKKVPLDSLILQMMSMGLPNIKLFPFIEPPSSESLDSSLNSLKSHEALTSNEELTNIGKLLSQLPVDISIGKMLIMGSLFHQIEPVLSMAAVMSVQSPFTNKAFRDPDSTVLIKEFESNHGDPFTLLNSYREWLFVKLNGNESSRKWCQKRGLEEQRFYEITKLRAQFSQLLYDSGLHNISGNKKARLTAAERVKRHGELKQLKDLKKELHNQGQRGTKVLKIDYESYSLMEDEGNTKLDIKDVNFKISYDSKTLKKLYKSSLVENYKDIILLKIILCCGLYPNLAIADEHNNYKQGSDQIFHTKSKPFLILHPNSMLANNPEILELNENDIVNLPDFSRRYVVSCKHQLLSYVSLLETNKPYLMNSFRVPAVQILLLFSSSIDTNADFSCLVCDNFIEIKFPDVLSAQNLLFSIVQLRDKWSKLLDIRIKTSNSSVANFTELSCEADKLEKLLTTGIIELCWNDIVYSTKRLLAADVKILHYGQSYQDAILNCNPFIENETCRPNEVKGGVDLNNYLTYNCLIDTESTVTTITSFDSVCPYCEEELHTTVLDRFGHMVSCYSKNSNNITFNENKNSENSFKKSFYCDFCEKKLYLSTKDIFLHKKTHL